MIPIPIKPASFKSAHHSSHNSAHYSSHNARPPQNPIAGCDTHLSFWIDDYANASMINCNNKGLTAIDAQALKFSSGYPNNVTRVLNFNLNMFTRLVGGVFDELAMLEELYFGNNRLTAVGRNLFSENPLLRVIYLNTNHIVVVDFDFSRLAYLHVLNLNNNKIRLLKKYTFMRRLERLAH